MDDPSAVSRNPPPAGDPQTLSYQSHPRRPRKPSGGTIRTLYALGIVHTLAGAFGVLAILAPFFRGFEIYGDWDPSRLGWLPGLPLSCLGIVGIVYWTCARKIDLGEGRGAAVVALILASAHMVPVFAFLLAGLVALLQGETLTLLAIIFVPGPLFVALLSVVWSLVLFLGSRPVQ